MALINSKWRRDAGSNAADALARVGGCGLSAAILTKLTTPDFTSKSDVNKTIGNIASPCVALLGVAGDMFLAHPMLRAFCQGLYTYAIPKSIAVIAPAVGAYMGLKGLDVPEIMNGIRGVRGVSGTPAIMNGTPAYVATRQTAAAIPAKPSQANATVNESQANALAGSMIQN